MPSPVTGPAAPTAAATPDPLVSAPRRRPPRTPSLIQMEAVECGAASLGILLRHHGRVEPLETLRIACSVSRDGANAAAILAAAEDFGMLGSGKAMDLGDLSRVGHPVIIHWAFQHFMVFEGFRRRRGGVVVHVNDPATGPRIMSYAEFDAGFTGVVVDVVPGPGFVRGGRDPGILRAVVGRLRGMGGALSLTLLATALMVVPGIAVPLTQRQFIDVVSVDTDATRALLGPAILVASAVVLLILTVVQRQHLQRVEARMALRAATQFVSDLLAKPVAFFHQRHAADLTQRVESNFRVGAAISAEVVLALGSVAFVLVYGMALLLLDPALALLTIVVALLNVVMLRHALRHQQDAAAALKACDAGLARSTMQSLAMIASIKANGTEQAAFTSWAGYSAKVVSEGQRLGRGTALLTVLPTLLAAVNTVLVLVLGGLRASQVGSGVGALIAFQALLVAFSQPLTQLVNQSGRLQVIQADLRRIEDVLCYESDPALQTSNDEVEILSGTLTFADVAYSFSADVPWIQDLSFDLPAGSSVALVGASGSGKSTVGRLAAGLIAPRSGAILVDGIERSGHLRQSLSAAIAYIDQAVTLYEGTVRENVTLWDPAVSERAIVRALQDAEILDEVAQRAGGINAAVSEAGKNFSGGQRQRLEIARALAGDPALIILDEATSASDVVTEQKIMDNLRRRGCSMLIIAHRLSTIRNADRILVLDQGRVVESGTHEQLLESGSSYRALLAHSGAETREYAA